MSSDGSQGLKTEIRWLGIAEFESIHTQMLAYTLSRDKDSPDQIWLLQHLPVYTQGTSCNSLPDWPESGSVEPDSRTINRNQAIPVVKTDRGGQITYHGPGQLIVYLLLDIKRLTLGPKSLVKYVEAAIIRTLAELGIQAERQSGAPGVYVSGSKIAALGLRIKKGCCYHGLSLNIDMDLSPFELIDPCGYTGLEVTQISCFIPNPSFEKISSILLTYLREEIHV